MELAEVISEIIIDPERGLNEVLVSRKPLLLAIGIAIAGLFCQIVSAMLLESYAPDQIAGMFIARFLASVFSFAVFWFVLTAIFHFIATWHQTEGSSHHLFVLFGSSLVPLIFMPVAALLAKSLGSGGHFVFFLFSATIFIWVLSLQVKSLKLIYHWQTGKAILVYIMPFVSTFVLLFISTIMLIVLAFALFASYF
jgi:hypothetical protein